MPYDPEVHRRRSYRAEGYDYGWPGWYYLTLCAHGHRPLFGDIQDSAVRLNAGGRIVEEEWRRTEQARRDVELDAYVVMPNHLHGIVIIEAKGQPGSSGAAARRYGSPARTVGAVVRGFKSASTRRIRALTGSDDLLVWQRNYYDHIIRDEADLERIRAYIAGNPANWRWDEERFPS